MNELGSINKCLKKIFSNIEPGTEFGGLWLHDRVADLNDKYKFTYPDTILRIVRDSFRDEVICVNRRKSIYKFMGFKA